jgi:uracil-DNA glycosylase family 4
VGFLAEARARWPGYHARPVPAFGSAAPALLIVGLAPGLHGANATGRPFTGDHAGILLYRTMHEFGFATTPVSRAADDGLQLLDACITNAVRCVPPANKPLPAEVRTCNAYLRHDLERVRAPGVVLALGRIAHEAVLRALGVKAAACAFGHGRWHRPTGALQLVDSYHCSRYNTQTRRLTDDMFRAVFAGIRERLAA